MAVARFLERFRPLRSAFAMMFRMGAMGWIIVLVLIVMILGMIDNMLFNRGAAPNAAVATPGPTALPASPSGGGSPAAVPATPSSSVAPVVTPTPLPDPAAVAARAELSQAAKLLAEAADFVPQAVTQITAWQRDIEPLRDNVDGRAIAAHADLAQQMTFLLQQQRPSQADLQLLSERIKLLAEETDRLATMDPPVRLGPDKVTEVRELHRQAREAAAAWTRSAEQGRAIASEARRRQPPSTSPSSGTPSSNTPSSNTPSSNTPSSNTPSSNTPSSNTPPSASASVAPPATVQSPAAAATTPAPADDAAPAPSGAAPASAAVTPPASDPAIKTPSEPMPQVRTLQDAVERISDQAKIDALNEQIAKETKRKLEEELRKEQQRKLAEQLAVQKAKLVEEARSEEVQRVLQPFLERRNLQPRLAGASLRWRQTVAQQPISFSALEGVGALAETVQGLAMLARVGSSREISSPRWEYNPSPRTWSPDTQARLQQAQELLRRLGPTLVEESLLSP